MSGERGSLYPLDLRAENGKALPHPFFRRQCQTRIHSQTEPLGCHPGQAASAARAGAHRATGTMDPGSRCARPGWQRGMGRSPSVPIGGRLFPRAPMNHAVYPPPRLRAPA